uniref:Uncharacterized protein n=1 Tax=Ixodes ricinus TaxID=34613 RepID=A0A6B0UQX3_IXORI
MISLFLASSCATSSRCREESVGMPDSSDAWCTGVSRSRASRAAYRAISRCSSSEPPGIWRRALRRPFSPSWGGVEKPLWVGIGDGGTMCARSRVRSGSSGNCGSPRLGRSGTHRNDLRREWPSCLLGDL